MGMKNKQALTEQDIAALAAGGSTTLNAGEEQTAEQTAEAAAAAAQAEGETQEGGADDQGTADPSAATETPDNSVSAVQLLNAQLKEKDEALLAANVELSKLKDHVADISASADPLREIACKSINNMQVALGGSALDLQGMGSAQIVTEHARISAQFAEKFKVGGVAAVTSNSAASKEPQISPRHAALVNAVRFSKK